MYAMTKEKHVEDEQRRTNHQIPRGAPWTNEQ